MCLGDGCANMLLTSMASNQDFDWSKFIKQVEPWSLTNFATLLKITLKSCVHMIDSNPCFMCICFWDLLRLLVGHPLACCCVCIVKWCKSQQLNQTFSCRLIHLIQHSLNQFKPPIHFYAISDHLEFILKYNQECCHKTCFNLHWPYQKLVWLGWNCDISLFVLSNDSFVSFFHFLLRHLVCCELQSIQDKAFHQSGTWKEMIPAFPHHLS